MEFFLALVLVLVAILVGATTTNGVLQLLAVAGVVLGVILIVADVVVRLRDRNNRNVF